MSVRHPRRHRSLAAAVILAAVAGLLGAGAAAADDPPIGTAGYNFALTCKLDTSVNTARVDLLNFFRQHTAAFDKVDADGVWFRGLKGDYQTPFNYSVKQLNIELYDGTNGTWIVWTTRSDFTSPYTYNPGSITSLVSVYTKVRMRVLTASKATCTSASRNI